MRTAVAFERERMHRAFALEVLRQLPPSDRHRAAERLSELAEYAITPTISALDRSRKMFALMMLKLSNRERPFQTDRDPAEGDGDKRTSGT